MKKWLDSNKQRNKTFQERFWEKVDTQYKDNCWEWLGTKPGGYGQIKRNRKRIKAHRVSWELHFGKIPQGMLVCHTCDNPSCVNPNHLFLGTPKDNMQDMLEKGRDNKPKGEKHGHSKLTADNVLHIRELYDSGNYTQKDLAKLFKVGYVEIHRIVRRKRWKHI